MRKGAQQKKKKKKKAAVIRQKAEPQSNPTSSVKKMPWQITYMQAPIPVGLFGNVNAVLDCLPHHRHDRRENICCHDSCRILSVSQTTQNHSVKEH